MHLRCPQCTNKCNNKCMLHRVYITIYILFVYDIVYCCLRYLLLFVCIEMYVIVLFLRYLFVLDIYAVGLSGFMCLENTRTTAAFAGLH